MFRTITKVVATLAVLTSTVAMAETRLNGAGATFPNPLYQRWITEYQKTHPEMKINYESIGSGGGIKGIIQKVVDFAGSDAPMSKKEIGDAKDPVVHIPTVAGAVAAAYNLPNMKDEIKLSGSVLADIFMGKITKWNDAKIAALNEGVKLPDTAITPVYRTDGSGTNFIFTSYLATQSEAFANDVGTGKQVKWPVGQGGKGSEGVTAVLTKTEGAIGYTEMNYATANKLSTALMQNADGKFIKPSPESVSAAGEGAVDAMKEGKLAVNIWNQKGEKAYPISGFTYIIVYKDLGYMKDPAKAKALVDFLTWATHDGEKMATELDYAPLSDGVQKKVDAELAGLTCDGKAVAAK